MRKKVLIPLVVASLVATALSVPAAMAREQEKTAAPPTSAPPKSAPAVETCTQVKKNLAVLAKAGQKKAFCNGTPKAASSIGGTQPGAIGVQGKSPFPAEIC